MADRADRTDKAVTLADRTDREVTLADRKDRINKEDKEKTTRVLPINKRHKTAKKLMTDKTAKKLIYNRKFL